MPRTARSIEAGMVDHVLNRGNGRLRLFHKEGDYDACDRVLVEGLKRYPVDLLTYCLMPNHWHLVVRPRTDVSLGRLMGWVGVMHVRRHHEPFQRRGAGHLYQGDSRAFPWQRTMTSSCSADTSRPTRCAANWWNVLSNGDGADCRGAAHYSNDLVLSPWPVQPPGTG